MSEMMIVDPNEMSLPKLRTEITRLRHDIERHIEITISQQAENERLRSALKPFAECIHEHHAYVGNPDAEEVEVGNWAFVRFNDFVRARKALIAAE